MTKFTTLHFWGEVSESEYPIETKPEQPKKCDHPCHTDIGYTKIRPGCWTWKVCPMGCGLPLAGKEEGR